MPLSEQELSRSMLQSITSIDFTDFLWWFFFCFLPRFAYDWVKICGEVDWRIEFRKAFCEADFSKHTCNWCFLDRWWSVSIEESLESSYSVSCSFWKSFCVSCPKTDRLSRCALRSPSDCSKKPNLVGVVSLCCLSAVYFFVFSFDLDRFLRLRLCESGSSFTRLFTFRCGVWTPENTCF